MASENAVVANRNNAQSSTGPTTAKGKAVVRYNALQHGLRAEHLLLPDEDPDALDALQAGLQAEMQPEGVLQSTLFELILSKLWRLQRVSRAETAQLLEHWNMGIPGIQEGVGYAVGRLSRRLSEYERSLENSLYKALAQFQGLKFSEPSQENGFVRE